MMGDFDIGGAAADFGGQFGGGGGDYQPISSYLPSSGPSVDPTAMSGPTGGGGGFGGFMSDLSGYAKQALPFLQLGTAGLGAYSGIRGMQEAGRQQGNLNTAQSTAQGVAAPALAAGQQLIPAGTSALLGGQLPPAQESMINQWKNNWRTQLRQYAAKAGISESTMMQQYEGMIESQAQELRAQLAQQLLTSGTSVMQPALQGAQIGGQMAMHQGDAATAAITNANAALAKLLGAQQ